VGAVVSSGLNLVASMAVARILGKSLFGEFGMVQTTVSMFASFAGLGMGVTAAKHVAEYRLSAPVRAGQILGMSSLLAWTGGALTTLVILLIAPWVARATLRDPQLTEPIRVAALTLLFGTVNGAQAGGLNGFEAFRRVSANQVMGGLIYVPILIGGVWRFGLIGGAAALVVQQIIGTGLNYWALRQEASRYGVPFGWRGAGQHLGLLWAFSLPAFLAGCMFGPVSWLASAIIVHTPNGYAELGVFSAASQWRNAILFVPTLLGGVALSVLSNLRGSADGDQYRKLLGTNIRINLFSSASVAVVVALGASWIMSRYGRGFESGGLVLQVLCAASVIAATLTAVGQFMTAEGRIWAGFALNGVWAVVLVSSCTLLKNYGALGLALANLSAYAVHLVTVSAYVKCVLIRPDT
jgi:O-antigen/teichoic acid export membrane protein